ncbi:sigma-70 family RNA polymerase sigma factor [Ponticaulis sp.]|uniref:sigma-70 family RNA polymerase sigma factor n=1 Tax=Ponticaulis sp. TaxID=2020902 RepID=UPI0025D9B248|nr:sigma-70 family RNA polymerase sigma factor [Ponticaulis sp.]|tara:strand:- start:2669 stop:3232 length:564 start_codon:yes stop_codon:yes gene_type:complete
MDDTETDPVVAYSDDQTKIAGILFDDNYESLLRIARSKRKRTPQTISLLTMDILHESYLKLRTQKTFSSDEHFMSSAVLAIRHVITDYARKRIRKAKHGEVAMDAEDAEHLFPEYSETPEQIVEISNLLSVLERDHPRSLRVLDARYFAGMTEQETADMMGMSTRSVRRDWQAVREWLAEKLGVNKA